MVPGILVFEHAPHWIINYGLKSEVAIVLHLCSITNVQETSLHESSCYGKCRQKGVTYTPIICIEKWGGHRASLLAMLQWITEYQFTPEIREKNMTRPLEWEPYCIVTNRHLVLSAKRTGTQRKTKVSPQYVYYTYCGQQKGTSRYEVHQAVKKPSQ